MRTWQNGNATVPLRLLRRPGEGMHLLAKHDHPLSSHSRLRFRFATRTARCATGIPLPNKWQDCACGHRASLDPCSTAARSLWLRETDTHVEVPGVNCKKLADDRLGKPRSILIRRSDIA